MSTLTKMVPLERQAPTNVPMSKLMLLPYHCITLTHWQIALMGRLEER